MGKKKAAPVASAAPPPAAPTTGPDSASDASDDAPESATAAAPQPAVARKTTDEKKIEEIMKTLGGLPDASAKLATLAARHAVVLEEAALAKKNLKSAQKTQGQVLRERDHLNVELQKSIVAKAKMETLCRELQKVNKTLKEDSIAKIKDQEQKRKELSDKFKETLTDIQDAMAQGKERSEKLSGENQRLSNQLQCLVEKYEAKEEHTQKLVEVREAKAAVLEAKLTQAQARLSQLSSESLGEKESLIIRLKDREVELGSMIDVEQKLRKQLDDYGARYQEFQSDLATSNSSFAKFKGDMDEMAAQLAAVEKESKIWRDRYQDSAKALAGIEASNAGLEKKVTEQTARMETMAKITRALQEERVGLLKQINEAKNGAAVEVKAPENLDIPKAENGGGCGGSPRRSSPNPQKKGKKK